MTEQEILDQTRALIRQLAGDDPDKWWYANRFVFARLSLDERKTKTHIKKRLLDSKVACHACGRGFDSRTNVHLHRLDDTKGYSDTNCVLMHADCHIKYHATAPDDGHASAEEQPRRRRGRPRRQPHMAPAGAQAPPIKGPPVAAMAGDEPPPERQSSPEEQHSAEGQPSLVKWSKRYADAGFLYWWDITPTLAKSLSRFEMIEFACKDTRQRCVVPVSLLKDYLTPDRQTSRGQNNWGIRVLKDHQDALAFEPGVGSGDKWALLPVVWLGETED